MSIFLKLRLPNWFKPSVGELQSFKQKVKINIVVISLMLMLYRYLCFWLVNIEVSNTQATELGGCLSQEASISDIFCLPTASKDEYSWQC